MPKMTNAAEGQTSKVGPVYPGASATVRNKRASIQWPSAGELEEVLTQLRQINQIGISSEAKGNYFMSGDLAYELHEIVRATRELLKKSLRGERA